MKSKYVMSGGPAFSDESDMEKLKNYISIRNRAIKVTVYSLIIGIALMGLLVVSVYAIRPMFLFIFGLLIIDIMVLVFNFVTYLSYNSIIKQIKKDGKFKSKAIINKNLWKMHAFIGATYLTLGILYLIEKKNFAVLFIILSVSNISSSLKYYKKYKKSL